MLSHSLNISWKAKVQWNKEKELIRIRVPIQLHNLQWKCIRNGREDSLGRWWQQAIQNDKKQIIAWAKSQSWEHSCWVYCEIHSIPVKGKLKRISYDSIQSVGQEAGVDTNEEIFHSEAGRKIQVEGSQLGSMIQGIKEEDGLSSHLSLVISWSLSCSCKEAILVTSGKHWESEHRQSKGSEESRMWSSLVNRSRRSHCRWEQRIMESERRMKFQREGSQSS